MTPPRGTRKAERPHETHTPPCCISQREQKRVPSSNCVSRERQVGQFCVLRHDLQTMRRALPLVFNTQAVVAPGVEIAVSSSVDSNEPATGTDARSTISIFGHPCAESTWIVLSTHPTSAPSEGTAEVRTIGTPASRARSVATSAAFHVGALSS